MTRVLMTTDTYGGVFTYVAELSGGLAEAGHEVHVAAMGRPMSVAQREQLAASNVASVHESEVALEWMPDPWEDVERAGDWLLGIEADVAPDVVHLNGYCHATLGWHAPVVVVAHSCVLSWWWAVHGEAAPAGFGEYRSRVREGLEAAGAVVAPTPFMCSELERWYGYDRGTVIANCRRGDWVSPGPKETFVLASGRLWDEAKNLALIERAAPQLGFPVIVAGDRTTPTAGGPTADRAADRPAEGTGGARLGLGDRGDRAPCPMWLGEVAPDVLATWLARALVYAAPARYEPFGLGALEAGLAGCALVLGDIPSYREIWGDAAIYVGPDDIDGFAAVVRRLLGSPKEAERLGRAAQRRATAFSPEECSAAYLRLYDQLLDARVPE